MLNSNSTDLGSGRGPLHGGAFTIVSIIRDRMLAKKPHVPQVSTRAPWLGSGLRLATARRDTHARRALPLQPGHATTYLGSPGRADCAQISTLAFCRSFSARACCTAGMSSRSTGALRRSAEHRHPDTVCNLRSSSAHSTPEPPRAQAAAAYTVVIAPCVEHLQSGVS
jgi:hypothetical protein